MKCPFCKSRELKVTDSREAHEANAIRRRRECLVCNQRFTTFETVELQTLQVKKRDGRFQDFEGEKILTGIVKAVRHTRVSRQQAQEIASKLVDRFIQNELTTIDSREIGEQVMAELKELDCIAYIRFACEYRRFRDVGELMEAIRSVQEEPMLQGEKLCH